MAAGPCNEGGALAHVPANVNYFSPFSSLDLRLQKTVALHEGIAPNLIGEGFNLFNQVNVRGTSNANFAGRNISIASASSFQQPNPVQANFYQPVSTAGASSVPAVPVPSSSPHGWSFDHVSH